MKIIDLVVLDFNLELKDKTVFKVLNQIGHDKYIYNREDRKFHVFEYETEIENTTLDINSESIAWKIEIIGETKEVKLPEKLLMHYNDNVEEEIMLNRARINMILDYLKSKEEREDKE